MSCILVELKGSTLVRITEILGRKGVLCYFKNGIWGRKGVIQMWAERIITFCTHVFIIIWGFLKRGGGCLFIEKKNLVCI